MINFPSSVAICAMAKTGQIDVSDYEMVIGINNTHVHVDIDPDLIIAMDDLKRDEKPHPDYVDAIVRYGCPVLSTRKFRKWPNVEPYPLERVAKWVSRQFKLPADKLLDCSISCAIALCLSKTVAKIGLSGVDLTPHYRQVDLECAMIRFKHRGYARAPDWFKYYEDDVLAFRRPREPGWESIHALIGFGMARGVDFEFGGDTTLFNMDRERFYYGYNGVPKI